MIKFQTFDLSYLFGKSYFDDDYTQSDLAFKLMHRHFEKISNTELISSWKSEGLSNESNKPPAASSNNLGPALSYIAVRTRVKFDGTCLKQDKITFTHGNVVNVSSFYEKFFFGVRNDEKKRSFTILVRNDDKSKHKYGVYGIGLNNHGIFFDVWWSDWQKYYNIWC